MDEIIRAVTKDGFVKISAISARGVVERAREIHGLAPTAAAALGRTLCGASMLGELMKEEDASLTIRVNGGGPDRQRHCRVGLRRQRPRLCDGA
ncbi:MAG: Hsp33 family molecular chaperone HslO [Lachnospiraceae bacterium]